MIIVMLFNVTLSVLDFLVTVNIPLLPEQVNLYLDEFFTYIATGGSIIANYMPTPYILTLFGISVSIDIALGVYHLVMWILNKIPAIDID